MLLYAQAPYGLVLTRDALRSPGRGSKYHLLCSGGPAFAPMMEPTKLGDGDNQAELRIGTMPILRGLHHEYRLVEAA
jgi:hypothetical protein